MAPPYASFYNYFRYDANEFIHQNRNWTTPERLWTISTIWAGDGNVKNYYATQTQNASGNWKATSPGLPNPNPIPVNPFTAADVNHAKTTQTMLASATAPGANVLPVAAAPAYVSSNLHDFWPRLPWSAPDEPAPPFLDMQALKDDVDFVKEHWLDTEPRMPPPNDNSRWHGIKLLGSGSYGAAGLWAEADAANNIRDRMVIKEAKAFTPSRWRDPKNWRDRLPQEIRIHQLLEERRAVEPAMCRHIIRCRAHRLWMEHRRYRLYLDYHSGGDMNAAMTFHAKNWKDGKPTDEDIFVPEGFVWYTIKALATACLVLREGTTDDTQVDDGWRPITHLDLQLPNILLNVYTPQVPEAKGKAKAGPSKSAGINRADADDWRVREPPVMPVLADFGISFFSPDRGDCPITDNPDDYVIHDTDTRYPPEMHQQEEPYYLELGERTDVWGIGHIAWRLLCNKQVDAFGPIRCDTKRSRSTKKDDQPKVPLALRGERNVRPNDEKSVLAEKSTAQYTAGKYGREVKELVRKCLNFDHNLRPTLREILAEIDQSFSDDDVLTDQIKDKDGLRLTMPDTPEFAIGQPVNAAKRRGRE